MFRDLLSSRWVQGGLAFFVLCVGGSLLYSWHVVRTTESEMARHHRLLGQQKHKETRPVESVNVPTDNETPGFVSTPDANTDTQRPDTTEALPNETEFVDLADAFLPDDVVSEEVPAEEVPVSRFGLGPYPETPKEWNFLPSHWEEYPTIEEELLTRVTIKMHNEGIRSKYGSVGMNPRTGQIIALERGSVLVEYDIDENGEKRIWRTLAHPDDAQGMYTRFSDIPSHLKVVTPDEIGFDPYEYLGLSK